MPDRLLGPTFRSTPGPYCCAGFQEGWLKYKYYEEEQELEQRNETHQLYPKTDRIQDGV